MNKLFYKRCLLIFLTLLLNACATTMQPLSTQLAMQQNQWSLQGRIAVKTPTKGESASLYWQQQGLDYYMRVFGPLGVGAVQLHGAPGNVTLVSNNGKTYTATTPEALVEQTLGWQLPVSNLQYWIRGIKAPKYSSQTVYDTEHRLMTLQQQGWTINYLSYQSDSPDALPRLLSLTRGDLNVRVAIDRWGA